MEKGHPDLTKLRLYASAYDLDLFAYAESDDPMALNSTDNMHVHVFGSFHDIVEFVERGVADGTLDDDMDPDLWGYPEVADVLDDPSDVLDITFHL